MLKNVKELGCTTASKILNIDETTVRRWRKEVRLLGEEGLIPGKGIQSIGKRQGRPKTLDFNEMTKQELIEYIEVMNDIKKYLEKSTKKKKYFVIFSLKKKYQISYLCWILKVSKSGYYKWIKNGMNEFNKWNKFLANIIKNIFYEFKEIYGYKMITLWILNCKYKWDSFLK